MIIRPPAVGEWPVCRMLLPESFDAGAPPDAFLAWDDAATVLGAVAFHRLGADTVNTRVRTIVPYRRRGVGSALLAAVCDAARVRGDARVCARVDFSATPDAAPFLAANGFVPGPRLFAVEGALPTLTARLRDFQQRLQSAGKIPSGARIISEQDVQPSELACLYRELVEPALQSPPVAALQLAAGEAFDASVLLLHDEPIGMIVGHRTNPGGCAAIDAIAVAPQWRGGWSWANLLLLSHEGARALAAGATRIRFDVEETNWRIFQSIARIDGAVTSAAARFIRELGP